MSNAGDVPPPAPAPAPPKSLAWGKCPELYLSYGTAALKHSLPSQADTVVVVPSFTMLSPPMGLDYFAVFGGGSSHPGAAVAERLRARLRGAIAEQVELEQGRENPMFGGAAAAPSVDAVVSWWGTVVEEAFRAVFNEEAARDGEDAPPVVGVKALAALVMEKYTVIASCGDSIAMLCRGGEYIKLTPDPDRVSCTQANKEDEKKNVENAGAGHDVAGSSSKLDLNVLQATDGASGSSTAVVILLDDDADKKEDENKNLDNAAGAGEDAAGSTAKFDLNVLQATDGASGSSSAAAPPVVMPELDVVLVERKEQDEFLILASDELWEALTPAAACAFLRRRLVRTSGNALPWEKPVDAMGSPNLLARELAEMACRAGCQDVISVAIVLFRNFWAALIPKE